MVTVTLEQQNLVRHELVADLHSWTPHRHARYGEPNSLRRRFRKKLIHESRGDMTLKDKPSRRYGGMAGLITQLDPMLKFELS